MAADAPDDPITAAPPPGAPVRPPSRRAAITAALAGIGVLGLTAAVAAPRPGWLREAGGDAELGTALAPHLREHRRVAAVLREADGTHRTAGFGADENTAFEIGSLTKTFTGALLMEGAARGELTLGSTVAEVLGTQAEGSPIADVRLDELASHTSGLPRLPAAMTLPSIGANLLRRDPYRGWSPQDVVDAALTAEPSGRGEEAYSNLGVALLGQLLARAAGTTWQELLDARLLAPLRLSASSAPVTAAQLPADAPRGRTAAGLPAQPWAMDGFAPAGGMRSTIADMGRWLESMVSGTNPGAAGLDPISTPAEEGGSSTAVVWVRSPLPDGAGEMIWHNGMTGGFSSFCGWLPETGRGVVLLSDTARSLDELAAGVLTGAVAA
ncbi:serine hydrolase domain-containing protein [Brachybacterium hainanense]|uniref:Serine hydrolase domain-containing protein n=1 Tax=Brachybacterium hainanense TaxID=1541174 RepID=A0ABV6RBS9_9MICO